MLKKLTSTEAATKLFETIQNKVQQALPPQKLDIIALNEVIYFIHTLDEKTRELYEDLYLKIGLDLFPLGIELPQYNRNLFVKSSKNKKSETKIVPSKDENDFYEKLNSLLDYCKQDIELLSRCFLLRFGNDKSLGYTYLLLNDFHSKAMVHGKIKTRFHGNCEVKEIDEFIDFIKSNPEKKSNYIVLLTLSSHINPQETILKDLEVISEYITSIEQIVLVPSDDGKHTWNVISQMSNITDEIKYLVSKDLRDNDIDIHAEKILKKMFRRDGNHILRYKKISVGFSGSMVVQVEPSGMYAGSLKYIVKIGDAPETRAKIIQEDSNFHTYVLPADATYKIDLEKTDHCTAIKYNFASKNAKIASQSFSKKYNEFSLSELNIDLESLFKIDLMLNWNTVTNIEEITFENYYKDFVNVQRFYEKMALIYNKDLKDVSDIKLVKLFDALLKVKFNSYTKTCHGDLHTDNFFIDEQGNVFLIDFGDTGNLHALIDYATLECSIKFRHINRYIDNELLIEIEKELLDINSSIKNFRYQSFNRGDLEKPFGLIATIRNQILTDGFVLDKDSNLEYLYSLFMITIRQIRYDNLNQLYAIKSAEIIGDHILTLVET